MNLSNRLEYEGNLLFRYRGQLPVILFILAIPVILFTDYGKVPDYWKIIITITSIGLSIVGFIVRSITIGTTPAGTSGRNTGEQVAESLNTKGIYSIVRHPLYLGNYLMWIGIVVFTMNFYFVFTISLIYWLYYERIMLAEERFLEKKFGEPFNRWAIQTPAFFPSFRKYEKSNILFSIKSVLRREYSGFLATVTGFLYVAIWRDYSLTGNHIPSSDYVVILVGALIITLTLRTIKHHTKILREEGRS